MTCQYNITLINFFGQLGMSLTPFSSIWVFQILIGYSKFLLNAYKPILLFSIGYFVDVKTFQFWIHSLTNGSYSRTSVARTRRARRCEFDPSMCSSDT